MNGWTVFLAGLSLVLFGATMYLVVVSLVALLRGEARRSTVRLLVAVPLVFAGYLALVMAAYVGQVKPGSPVVLIEDQSATGHVDYDALKNYADLAAARADRSLINKRLSVRIYAKTIHTASLNSLTSDKPIQVAIIYGQAVDTALNRVETAAPVTMIANLPPDRAGIQTGNVFDVAAAQVVAVADQGPDKYDDFITLAEDADQAQGGKLVLLVQSTLVQRQ